MYDVAGLTAWPVCPLSDAMLPLDHALWLSVLGDACYVVGCCKFSDCLLIVYRCTHGRGACVRAHRYTMSRQSGDECFAPRRIHGYTGTL